MAVSLLNSYAISQNLLFVRYTKKKKKNYDVRQLKLGNRNFNFEKYSKSPFYFYFNRYSELLKINHICQVGYEKQEGVL